MLFDVKQFEHHFKERTLKKGLKLFEKGELEFVGREAGFDYHFLVEKQNLYLKKKGDKLINYTCSCESGILCEHLSAVMFYFQQEALGIAVKNKTAGKKKRGLHNATGPTYAALKQKETESLLKLIKEHKNTLTQKEISSFLSDKLTLGISDVYARQVTTLIEPYLPLKKIDQKSVDALKKTTRNLIKAIEKEVKEKDLFFLYTAILEAYVPLFNARFTEDETELFDIYHNALTKLDTAYKKGLTEKEKTQWFRTTLNSVESNKNLHTEAFMFLIPRFASISKSETELALLHLTLKKRVYKIPYSHHFDKLLIARFEVALREWKLFKIAFPLHQEGGEIEQIIAKAELEFCSGNILKAFKLLEADYEVVRTLHKAYYNDYLAYILKQAQRYEVPEIEVKYLRESFIHRLFILPEELDRFLELTPKAAHSEKMEELIAEIKTRSKGYYFDKISLLLLKANLLDELIRELKKQNNKFSLIHEIALKKFPGHTPAFLVLYMKHLAETLRQDSVYMYQLKLFNTAKVFLDMLPEKEVIELIKKLLDQIGKTGHLYRYINELYDYPFLKEEGNY